MEAILERLIAIEERLSINNISSDNTMNYARAARQNAVHQEFAYNDGTTLVFNRGGGRRAQNRYPRQQYGSGTYPSDRSNATNHRYQPSTEPQSREPSQNTDFAILAKTLFHFVQVRRGIRVWNDVPKGIDRLIDESFNNIIVPMPDDNLRSQLGQLRDTAKTEVLQSVQQHLFNKELEITQSLANLNPLDKFRAAKLARAYALKQLGRKIQPADLYNWIGEALDLVGSNYAIQSSSAALSSQAAAAATAPTFSEPATIHTRITTARETDWHTASRQKRKYLALVSPATITNNRFDALALEEDSDTELRSKVNEQHAKKHRQISPDKTIQENSIILTSEATIDLAVGVTPGTGAGVGIQSAIATISEITTVTTSAGNTDLGSTEIIAASNAAQDVAASEETDRRSINDPTNNPETSETSVNQDDTDSIAGLATVATVVDLTINQHSDQEEFFSPEVPSQNKNKKQPSQPSPSTSASQPSILTGTKPIIHTDKFKKDWSLNVKPGTKTVVIADSNFRNATELPQDWEVHVYPGMNLVHASDLVNASSSLLNHNLRHILISAGINNRDWSFVNAKTDLNKLACALAKTGKSCHFLGISIPPGLPHTERSTLEQINDHAKRRFEKLFINPLEKVSVSVSDSKYGIHYDQATINNICNKIMNHFLCLPSSRTGPRLSN